MNKIITFMRESGPARALIPLGVILIVCGVIFFIINKENQDYIQIESTVTNVELLEDEYLDADGNIVAATYSANVKYVVNDREYDAKLDNVSKYDIGDKVTIYYNPQDPNQVTMSKSLVLPIVLMVGGVAALVGGIISGVNAIKRYKKMKEQEKGWENGQ